MGADKAVDWVERWRGLFQRPDPQVTRRLHQGREFQRAGRVTDLRVQAGHASARVQDARAMPVPVEVAIPVLSEGDWDRVVEVLAAQIRHSARLLAGHAPEGLDAELASTGTQVFPRREEVAVSCDCTDEVVPCAHGAALLEELADALEADPFVLFRLRGRGRERLLGELARARRRRTAGERPSGVAISELEATGWTRARPGLDEIAVGAAEPPATPAGPLKLLGDPPGWAGGPDAWSLLHPLVEGAAQWIDARDVEAEQAAGGDGDRPD